MYCGECGKKIESGSLFCGECGAKVIQEDSPATLESTVKENTKKNKKPMSKLQKILLVSVLVLFVVLFTTYQVLNSYYSPENVAEDYFSAIADKDMDRLYQYLNLEGDTTFASKEIFKNSSDLLETEEIQNYTVNDAVYDEGKLSARVTVYYMLEGNSSESSTVITLTKEKEKKLLFFDSWVISNNQGGLVAKDYSITVPKGSKVLIDDISLESKYLDKELCDDEDDVYTIPVIFRKTTEIKTTFKNGIVTVNTVTPSNSYNYKVKLSLSSIEEKQIDQLEEVVEKSLVTIYGGIIEKKSFDEIKSNFEYPNADLKDLSDVYTNVLNSLSTSSNLLKKIDFTSTDITALNIEDDLLYIRAKVNYNYTIEYKELFSDEIKTKDSKDYTYVALYYDYVDGDYKLVDAQRLMSYFSKY